MNLFIMVSCCPGVNACHQSISSRSSLGCWRDSVDSCRWCWLPSCEVAVGVGSGPAGGDGRLPPEAGPFPTKTCAR
ncbi:hypothetical protein PF005_g22554 [Phytophthora fragariae]|uniref:Uncharacterized protein n=1 Tax=Phytophthora fragariae TaxID=53985 RepID=A0A6A3WBI4_9STRA|nr:hypothetical protein PF009_g22424 [Phytophthora fragariae]KAE9083780.1 hypothetical protein PF007_g21771 [Phytophthora fragariae]KAE9105855.1 hypothetical protein PF006_g21506 [Phytophthora fragariae]KAE9182288.1 hypothetical protein PF005_g22554 [Phytophthora fragariae]KAE9198073.1 hypothetical protein PF002_g22544 [Phytophthora fragariae]